MTDANTQKQQQNKEYLLEPFFNNDEINTLKKKMAHLKPKNIVFCSFENRFARSGGLAAVTKTVLPALAEKKEIRQVLLMTPFYPYIIPGNKLTPTGITPFKVPYNNHEISVELLEYKPEEKKVKEYYIKAPGFFAARNPINDPYIYFPDNTAQNEAALRENALFFCKAVPLALKALGIQKDIVFHLQEWQTCLIALTGKEAMLNGTLDSCGCVQTMHNPFDSWISADILATLTDNQKIREEHSFRAYGGATAYQLGLPLMDAPVTTVSEHFAAELTTDLLQTEHFANHLQDILKKKGVIGINNGMFINFPPEFATNKKYTVKEIKKIKTAKRKALLDILDTYQPPERFGRLTFQSQRITALPDQIPILVMSGRLDPFQKGFDILLRALSRFARDEIKAVISPMPIKDSDLDYFREITAQCDGNITVFPIRMEEGYLELQMGSTFGIMPSIYEPFGAAVEYMVNGTVNIAHQTGGLVNQIEHKTSGILYRENPGSYTIENIKAFAQDNEKVKNRDSNPWAQNMALELYKAIAEAADLYRHRENDYYRMIIEGFRRARTFTWQKAADAYFKHFQGIS